MVAMLKATSSITSVVANSRFRRPTSVAKYQPKRTSSPRPAKNVRAGLIFLSCRAKSRHLLLFQSFSFQNIGDRRFLHLDLHVVSHFNDHGGFLHVGDQPVNAGVRHNSIAGFYTRNQTLLLLLPFFLRTNQNKIHNDDDEKPEGQEIEKTGSAARSWSRRGRLCLS